MINLFVLGPLVPKDRDFLKQNLKALCQNMNMAEVVKKMDPQMWTAGLKRRDVTSKSNNYAKGKALIEFICDNGLYM